MSYIFDRRYMTLQKNNTRKEIASCDHHLKEKGPSSSTGWRSARPLIYSEKHLVKIKRNSNKYKQNNSISTTFDSFHRTILARLSKAKSTTHDFAQAIMKKLLKQKTYYPIS